MSVTVRGKKRQGPGIADEGEVDFARPFLKWAGSKAQLLSAFRRFYPASTKVKRYLEPFLGCGAVFFHVKALLAPSQFILWDNNEALITTFCTVRDNLEELIGRLKEHQSRHSKEYYYEIRQKKPRQPVAVAARLIYLNRTCFNGLYRENSKGIFNVPIGSYHNPVIVMQDRLLEAHRALQGVEIATKDFRELPAMARRGDFIYLDPPYHPRSDTAYFTSYSSGNFAENDQRDLADVYRRLDKMGCLVMLSNSDTPLVHKLYGDFAVQTVEARRAINSKGEKRGPVNELVVCNYAVDEMAAAPVTKVTTRPLAPLHKGDGGDTRLASGESVRKDDLRVECVGTVDELSSYLGLARAALRAEGILEDDVQNSLIRMQRDLHRLGALLAIRNEAKNLAGASPMVLEDVTALDGEVERYGSLTPRLKSFILPGGGVAGSHLHVARTICRRAERQVVRLFSEERSILHVIPYLNRLSLVLFMLARYVTMRAGQAEDLV